MHRALCLLALTAVSIPAAPAQTSDPSLKGTLFALSEKFMTDWQKHDTAALAASFAPEFVYVGPHGPIPRQGVINDLGTHCTLASYKLGEPQMLQTSAESAVLIYSIHQDLTCFGQPDVPDVLNTDTFVKRGGRWLFAMTTSTPLAPHP
jgi:hypothetical protein